MKIIAHRCNIDQPEVGSWFASWFKGNEIRISIAHIISYEPAQIYLKKNYKKPKTATHLYDINNKHYFIYESPEELDRLIDRAGQR